MDHETHSILPTMPAGALHELQHMQSNWRWFLLLGILLAAGGLLAIIVPLFTVATSVVAVIVLGAVLMVAGVGIIISSFWAGKWSGMLMHLLVGLLYALVGFMILDRPVAATVVFTFSIALIFIILGTYRIIAALAVRFPQWGWALLNGAITLLAGIIIYKHFPESALWVIGLLIGLEMLFNGWTWIMLALGLRRLPVEAI